MNRAIQFSLQTPAPPDLWDEIYSEDPEALPTQSRAWAQAISDGGQYKDRSRLYTFADGSRAVMPVFQKKSGMGLPGRLWSQPSAWGFGGPIADQLLNEAHLSAVLDDLAGASELGMHIRPNPNQADAWQRAAAGRWTEIDRTAHVLDLDGGLDAVWANRFKPRTRTAIRKAQTSDIEVEFGRSSEHIDAFYRLFEQSVLRWARKQNEPAPLALWRAHRRDPPDKFHAMASAMQGAFGLWLALYRGEAIAGILVLQDRNAHYTRGAMNEALAGPLSANVLLHYRAIEAACGAGCRYYHMGETGHSDSLAQFKSRFGAAPVPYAEYYRETVPITKLVETAKDWVKGAMRFRDA